MFSLGSISDNNMEEDNNNLSLNNISNGEEDVGPQSADKMLKLLRSNNFQHLLGVSLHVSRNTKFSSLNYIFIAGNSLAINPMLLSAQLAFAVQQQQQQQNGPPNPFMSAYANLLSNPSLLPSMMSESLKAARFSPYSKPHFNNTTITTSTKSTASLKSIKKNISIKSQQSLSSHKDEEFYLDNRMSLSDERLSSRNADSEDETSGAIEES